MSADGILASVVAYSIQVLLVLGLALPLPRLFGLKLPGPRLRFFGLLLITVLLLPALQSVSFPGNGVVPAAVTEFQMVVTDSMARGDDSGFLFPGILVVLGGVTLAGLLKFAAGLAQLRSITRSAVPIETASATTARLCDELSRRPTIAVSEAFSVPVSFGWRRPYILVPSSFASLDEASREAILCHELLHLKRGDWIATLFEHLVRILFWFHPAIHGLLDRIDLAREQLIDREVVLRTGRRRIYLETLKQTAETFRQASAAPAIPFIRVNHLKHRVASLTEEVCMSKKRVFLMSCALFFSVAVLSAAAVSVAPLGGPNLPEEFAAGPAPVASAVAFQESQEKGKEKEGQIDVSDEVNVRIKLVKRVNPKYPEEAKEKGITGEVICRIKIAETGKVTEVEVKKSPDELLSQAAVEAVKQWEYEPPTKDGEPVSALADVTIRFALK